MTFKEMIYKGLCDKNVKIISNPNDDCIACQIGDFWFYFIGSEYEDLTPDEVYECFTKEELTEMIYETLMDMEKNEFDEVEYYKAFLSEIYESRTEDNINVRITYKTGRYADVNENTEEFVSLSVEQAIHNLVCMFLHNNPEYKIEIVKAEVVNGGKVI